MITLATLPQATEQEVFDQVATHMLRQGIRSQSSRGCVYRSGDNLKCAAGCLIGDDEYSGSMEGLTWPYLASSGDVPSAHAVLIGSLQRIHDDTLPYDWPAELSALAKRFNLEHR